MYTIKNLMINKSTLKHKHIKTQTEENIYIYNVIVKFYLIIVGCHKMILILNVL